MPVKKPRTRYGRVVQRDISFADFETAAKSIDELPTIDAQALLCQAPRDLRRAAARQTDRKASDELLTQAARDYLRTELTNRRVRVIRPSERRRALMKLVGGKQGVRPGNTTLGFAVLSSLLAAVNRTREAPQLLRMLNEIARGDDAQYVSQGIALLRHHAPLALRIESKVAAERDRISGKRHEGDVALRHFLTQLHSIWTMVADLSAVADQGADNSLEEGLAIVEPRRRARISDGLPMNRDEAEAGPFYWFCHAVLQQVAQNLPGSVREAMPDLSSRLTSLTPQSLLEAKRTRARRAAASSG